MLEILKKPCQRVAAAIWLQENLGKTFDEALKFTYKFPSISQSSTDDLNKIYAIFKNNCFKKETLSKHPWVFTLNETLIKYKLEENNFHIVTKDDIPLINIPKRAYPRVIQKWKIDDVKYLGPNLNRIEYFSQQLNCIPQDMMNIMFHHMYLMSNDMKKLITIMNLLKENGIDDKKILSDMWIFQHNENIMMERVEECKSLGVPIRPWMLRNSDVLYKKYLYNMLEEYKALGNYKDKFEYLASELEIPKETIIQELGNGSISRGSAKRYRTIIELLKSKGFTSKDISFNFRILDLSPATIEERIEALQKLEVKLTLVDIIKSEKNFKLRIKYYQENNGDTLTLK